MKAVSSAIVLGIGLLMVSGGPARAQFGELGEAAKKGASEAVTKEMMKQAGLPTPGTPAVTPAASTPASEPKGTPGAAGTPAAAPGADAGAATAPVGEPKVAPEAAEAPAGAPEAPGTLQGAGEETMKKKMPKLP